MPSYPPPQLNDRQLMLAQLLALEKPVEEVAEIVGVSVQYVKIMKANRLFMSKVMDERNKYLESLRAAAREKIVKEADRSIDVVVMIRDNAEDEKVKLQAAFKLIDQAELLDKKMKVTETREVRVNLTPAQSKLAEAIIAEPEEE